MDDSDLFHMALGIPLGKEFMRIVQSASNDWVGPVHATGGLLKPQQRFWYMIGWIWKKGKACLKTSCKLPQTPLYIPQPDGTRVPIQIKTVNDPEKKLGVNTCSMSNFPHHVGQLLLTESEYAEKLSA